MGVFGQTFRNLNQIFSGFNARGILAACLVLVIVSLFVVELSPWLLDILLVINILVALTLLLRGLFLESALELFSFPTILVLTTLFRLALNVSSTKLILLHGDQGLGAAGEVIKAFGSFVVGGDFVVGAIVFAIIAIVNFVVIAKGSARVAEVSARFTLDALPGRQLSIDSDLRNGMISKEEASARRDELTRESQFFGAMDGAMKWVQGDAVAGLAITFINAVGGVSLGVSRGLTFGDSVDTFGVLTIGDGLVSILPSLLISVSAGIVVTYVAGKQRRDSGEEVFVQLVSDPRALVVAAVSLIAVGLLGLVGVIEFPAVPFFLVGLAMLFYVGRRSASIEEVTATIEGLPQGVSDKEGYISVGSYGLLEAPSGGRSALQGDSTQLRVFDSRLNRILVEVDATALGSYFGLPDGGGVAAQRRVGFQDAALRWRERVFLERGIPLPQTELALSNKLPQSGYRIMVRGQLARSGKVCPGCHFVSASPATVRLMGLTVREVVRHPLDNRTCAWVDAAQRGVASLEHLGVGIYSLEEYLVLEAMGAALDTIDELFGLAEVRKLLRAVEQDHQELVAEVFEGKLLSYPELAEVLRRLVRERVGISDLKLILEGISEFFAVHPEPRQSQEWLTELHAFLRLVLSRSIISEAVGFEDKLRVFVLSEDVEEEFRSAGAMWDQMRIKPPLDPTFEKSFKIAAERIFGPVLERGVVPIVVICPSEIRSPVQDFFGRQLMAAEWVRVLSYQELDGSVVPESVGVLTAAQ